MKKNLFYAVVAIGMLASCADNEYLGEVSPNSKTDGTNAIEFNTGAKTVTRSGEIYGAAAASLLNNNFVVEGIKTVDNSPVEVFDNYNVNYTENTADKTLSNTANWEYVGQTIIGDNKTDIFEQTIKYWDFAASQYDFWAYSLGTGSATVTSLDHDADLTTAAYTFTGSATDLAQVYVSDLVTAYNPSVAEQPEFKEQVNLTFRSLVAKIRIGLYETIPGYSVKDVKFYRSASENAKAVSYATLYASSNSLPSSGECTVYFPTIGSTNVNNSDYNKAHISFDSNGEKVAWMNYGPLSYGTGEKYEKSGKDDAKWLARTSAEPTWATVEGATAGDYFLVLPNEGGAVLTLMVDYTLESIDGSGEDITVHKATALVPSQYTQWKSNYAYTYIFKISDNTNGWTKPNTTDADLAGLYPITFDAIVIDNETNTQETITTVATPSITTYSVTSDVTTNDEYTTSDEVYVTAMKDGALQNFNNYGAMLYTVSKTGATEAEVLDALNTYTSLTSSGTYVGRNEITLTPVEDCVDLTPTEIPLIDGNKITDLTAGTVAKLTCADAGTYAFVYKVSGDQAVANAKYQAVTVAAGGSVDGLFSDNDGTDTEATANADKAQTLYTKYFTVENVTYAIKVIKVVAAASGSGSGSGGDSGSATGDSSSGTGDSGSGGSARTK